MKIMLITTLYPAYKNQSRLQASYAVHHFAKEWSKENKVKVIKICPTYLKVYEVFDKIKKQNYINNNYSENYIIDDVNIERRVIKKYPKIDYRRKDIKNTAEKIIKSLNYNETPDIIICDILNPSIYIGELIAKKTNAKLIASLHNSDVFYLNKKKNYKKFIEVEPSIKKIVFRSSGVERGILELENKYEELQRYNKKFLNIPFGVDQKEIIREEKLQEKIDKNIKEIMIACSLIKLKKVDVLIKAFVKINSENNYLLRIIGDGPELNNLINLSKFLNCEDFIIFEGEKSRKEVLKYMENADIFAMVSSPETFGLVYVEAMASGCITIASKGEGIDGVIVNNKNGYLCSPDSIEELKIKLLKAINLNKEEKENLLYYARKTSKELTNEKLAKNFLDEMKGE